MLPQIFDRYIKTGKLELIFLDLPLESIHPQAFNAAEAAHCAGEQELFWEMHHELYANQRLLMGQKLIEYAQRVGVELQPFTECLESGRAPRGIREDMRMARRARVSSTPAFLLGRRKPGDRDKVQVLETLQGAHPFEDFEAAIDRLLSESDYGR